MRDAWQIGRLFGIPLRIHVSWLIVFGLVSWSLAAGYFPAQLPDLPVWSYWTKAIIAAAMFFASVILHELGHSLVARRHGVGIASITLFVFGGVSEMRDEPRTPRWSSRSRRSALRSAWCSPPSSAPSASSPMKARRPRARASCCSISQA